MSLRFGRRTRRGRKRRQALYARLEAGKSIEPGDIDAAVRMGVGPRKPARATAIRWRCSRRLA
jgi:hypothetical protein